MLASCFDKLSMRRFDILASSNDAIRYRLAGAQRFEPVEQHHAHGGARLARGAADVGNNDKAKPA